MQTKKFLILLDFLIKQLPSISDLAANSELTVFEKADISNIVKKQKQKQKRL